jgi:DNA-binding winged helix-turn-helix (wHTH) protein/tetratricopeptide (TPR) repeat protein
MEVSGSAPRIVHFGLFEVDLAQCRLTRQGMPVRLQDQSFQVLTMLLEHPGEIVSREELQRRLWPEGTHVDFDGSLNAVLKRLRAALSDDPERPRFIETIPRRGYRFIAPVSREEKEETDREMPSPPLEEPGGPPPSAAVRRDPRRVAILAAVLLLALGGSAAVRRLVRARPGGSATASSTMTARRSVAVLGFQNTTDDPEDAWLSTSLSQMLSTELAAGEKLRIVSGEDVATLRASSPWPQTDSLGQSTASRIGTALGSDLLVLGSYAAAGKRGSRQLRLDARLQDAATGAILAEVAEVGSDQEPFAIVSRVGARLREHLGAPVLTDTDESGILTALPANGEAARLYAQGVMRLRAFDAVGARDFLQQAVAVDPKYPLAHSRLAQAWGQLGYDQKSREEAKKALDLSANLPRVDRMLVEGAYYESLADPEKAIATYRALLTMFPDSVDNGLRLVTMLNRMGRHEEALETIRQLQRLPPPAGDDARLDLSEAKEISYRNSPEAALPLQRGMDKAAARGQKLIYANARLDECVRLQYGDHPAASRPACQEAYDIFLAAGNRTSAASALRTLADRAADEGRKDEALRLYERAIAMLRETGSRSILAAVENNMALVLEGQGQLDRAEALFRDVKRNFEEVGDKLNIATALDNIADIQLQRGDLVTAAETYRGTIATSVTSGQDGYEFYHLAIVHRFQGHLKEAQSEAEQALRMFAARGADFRYATEAMIVLGDVLKAEGDLDGARRQYQDSLATRIKLGDPGLIAQSRVCLASLAIEEARSPEAVEEIRTVLPEFEKEKDMAGAATANVELTRALLKQGKIEEARDALRAAKEFSRSSPDPALRLPVDIQDARVTFAAACAGAARSCDAPNARGLLQSTITAAHRSGYVTLECDARLALGELELKANPALGRSELEVLAREAHQLGFDLISRAAASLLPTLAKAGTGPDSSGTH